MQPRPMPSCGVCVCLSRSCILSKQIIISSKFCHHPISTQYSFSVPNVTPIFRWKSRERRRRMQGGYKNHDLLPISRFISEMMQDIAIVTMEGKQETARSLSNGSIQRQITQKRYKIEYKIDSQWRTNKESYNGLSNGAVFYDLEQPLTHLSRSRYTLTLNIS